MRTSSIILACALIAGCGDNNQNGNHDLSMAGGGDGGDTVDLLPPLDLTDTTTPPAPTVKHVGGTGPTAGLVVAGDEAAYLLNPAAGSPATGELHVVKSDGTDRTVATGIAIGSYGLAPDGKSIVWISAAGQSFALNTLDLTSATSTAKMPITTGVSSASIGAGIFAPSGHYFIAGVLPPNVGTSPDFHVVDLRTGTDVYDRLNGAFDYIEVVLPDDTMLFTDTAGGMGTGGAPPVNTLYWVSIPNAMTAAAATINTHVTAIVPSADNKTLLFQRTNGDLVKWDLTAKTGAGTTLATGVTKFTIGSGANGPVAYLGGDKSVHVIGFDGTKLLDVTPTAAAADVFGSVLLAPDAADLYYWQNFDTQDHRGTLMRVAVTSGATPSKVGDKISSSDVNITDSALVLLQNVDDKGQFGDVVKANRDGTGITPLGMKANVGGLAVVNPGPATWFAMHLTAAVDDSATNSTINGSPAIYGGLAWADYTGAAEIALDAKAHAGTFAFAADDGRTAAFVTGATFNATAGNYVGSLALIAARLPSMKVDGMLTGVSELGPIVNRSLFVNAPTATMAGVYFVKY